MICAGGLDALSPAGRLYPPRGRFYTNNVRNATDYGVLERVSRAPVRLFLACLRRSVKVVREP